LLMNTEDKNRKPELLDSGFFSDSLKQNSKK
jgi:hypothetical protein